MIHAIEDEVLYNDIELKLESISIYLFITLVPHPALETGRLSLMKPPN